MSHQDRKSLSQIVINNETLKLVIDWLLKPALFSGPDLGADCAEVIRIFIPFKQQSVPSHPPAE